MSRRPARRIKRSKTVLWYGTRVTFQHDAYGPCEGVVAGPENRIGQVPVKVTAPQRAAEFYAGGELKVQRSDLTVAS